MQANAQPLISPALSFTSIDVPRDCSTVVGIPWRQARSEAATTQDSTSPCCLSLSVAVITQLVVGSTHAQLSSKKLSASKMHPTEVARQLSLLTSEQFQKISPNEFLNLGWLKPNKLEVAPNIVELISMFNTLGTWVATEVRSLARSCTRFQLPAVILTWLAGWLAGCTDYGRTRGGTTSQGSESLYSHCRGTATLAAAPRESLS